mmetsp:Transcript_25195/g.79050  ORF Transcript_25195/g.79050 Transcript_25195/m.79050 type:complete len:288 (-) Transcript_25195:134-997(-)
MGPFLLLLLLAGAGVRRPLTRRNMQSGENTLLPWTLEDDRELIALARDRPLPEVAAQLGRGLQGVTRRLAKLSDPDSAAYERLVNKGEDQETATKLRPAKEVIQRLVWDGALSLGDFYVAFEDRFDGMQRVRCDAANESIKGKERLFVLALPSHRVRQIYYKERVVWDREERLDNVFGTGIAGEGVKIEEVIATYAEWEAERERERRHRAYIVESVREALGDEDFAELKVMSKEMQEGRLDVAGYVRRGLRYFEGMDAYGVELFAELVRLMPDAALRAEVLQRIDAE